MELAFGVSWEILRGHLAFYTVCVMIVTSKYNLRFINSLDFKLFESSIEPLNCTVEVKHFLTKIF